MAIPKPLKQTQPRYCAFLRGINVGGRHQVAMSDLQKVLLANNCTNVVTLLASGNVAFDSALADTDALARLLETVFEKRFGFPIPTLVRSMGSIQKLVASHPFKGIIETKATRMYITFLGNGSPASLKIPFTSQDGNFTILRATKNEVVSVLTLSDSSDTTSLMSVIEKSYGKNVTTRNWHTIIKIARA